MALRDQEEELLYQERKSDERKFNRPKRTYWVEQGQEWGLMDVDFGDEDDDDARIHWIGRELPPEVYYQEELPEEVESAWWNEQWSDPWGYEDVFYGESDFTVDEVKELEEAYGVYESKLRTFAQARAMMKAKNKGRGFFQQAKGAMPKGKGSGKGKPQSPVLANFPSGKKGNGKGSKSEYTGCFICGSKEHRFQQCPRRQGGGSGGGGKGKGYGGAPAYVVVTANEGPVPELFGDDVVLATTDDDSYRLYGVIDSGATETVGSLLALENIMETRRSLYGPEPVYIYGETNKSFRFGNGDQMKASSYVEIPQTVGGHTVYMGMYTLDTPSYVPVLIGIKTLTRLGAVVDFQQRQAVFRGLNSNVVPLIHCNRTSHLLIDLARDWTSPDRVAVYTAVDLHLDWAHGIHEVEEEEDTDKNEGSQTPVIKTECAEKAKTGKNKKEKLPESEKYDFAREEGPDQRDPRCHGAPCFDQHEIMPFYRGSLSGKNAHGRWLTCGKCRLRISYVPAFGAHARFRQAGPLSSDVHAQLEEKSNEIVENPEVLNATTVAMDGAERSLVNKLAEVRRKKEELKPKAKAKAGAATTTPTMKKLTKREGTETAEELESLEDGEWKKVPASGK
ncbi:unnamed protein product [Effrenium voratum]|nr:unnamed protein product [Effrenium voratum]